MSFTFGFYNSIDHDRLYDAIQVSKIFDGIILDGVYETIGDGFIVQASEEADIVVVGPGRAWFNHTWNDNDGYLELELEAPETVLDRIDMIVIDVDERVPSRKNDILIVKGTPSSTPTKPTPIRETEHNQYPLAYVTRKAATSVISQSQIENTVGTSACPFVTGVLEGMDIDLLLLQWRQAWKEFLEACQAGIDEWEEAAKEDVATFVLAFKDQCNEIVTETAAWQTTQRQSFEKFYSDFKQGSVLYMTEYVEWVDSLKDILAEDALGNLLLELEKIQENTNLQIEEIQGYMKELTSGFQSKLTTFPSDNQIIEAYSDGSTITTDFLDDGNITMTLRSAEGDILATLKTIFHADGSIEEKVTGGNFQEYMLSKGTGVGRYINNEFGLNTEEMNTLESMTDVMNSSVAVTAILDSDTAWDSLKTSNITMKTLLSSDVAATALTTANASRLEDCLTLRFDETLANAILLTYITNTRDVLLFIFGDETMRQKFVDNITAMTKLTTDSDLVQTCIFAYSNAEANHTWVIKDHAWTGYPQWDIHTYTWAVFFGHIGDGGRSPEGEQACYVEFHPMGTDEPVYNWIYDSNKGKDILAPILVDISGGAYSICTRRINESGALATGAVTAMCSCVAF